ncbi:MAG: HD domain-containing protein [Gemmatimonadota bacterium]|nr:HD domain-containing protein [Gemmatimonadota bacterium]
MRKRQFLFACVVFILAITAGVLVVLNSPPIPDQGVKAILTLGGLAVVAEMLAFLLPHGARGSIAFIPYLTCVLVVPHWSALIVIAAITTVSLLIRQVRPEELLFNVSQQTLTLAIAILVYQGLGGQSFLILGAANLAVLTRLVGLAAISAYAVSFMVNTVIVSSFIAVKDGGSAFSVWREVKLATIGIDLLASPIVFVFAYIYSKWGPYAAAVVWVPIVGLRQVHKTNLELEQTNQELLELMVKSIEARDPYTSGHSRRVQRYSVLIARGLGLRESEISAVSKAALLHDVGKIHEKYGTLLSKMDRLSPDEWLIMQEHPADGADLVATMTRLRELVSAIRHHHENWDGTGYPDGLSGDRIPLAARIIRFADTIDAMTTQRPYRGALTEEQVKQEIVRCRATQFDPAIADRVLSQSAWATLFSPSAPAQAGRTSLSLVRDARQAG